MIGADALATLRRRWRVGPGPVHPRATTEIPLTLISTARFETTKASQYLQQLCKHWSHNLEVDFTTAQGRVVFPRDARGADWPGPATLSLTADDAGLDCRLEASAPGQREALEGAVTRHLERFAFREMPIAMVWEPT